MNVREEFEGCITEIGANKTLNPQDDYNKGWNDASDNAVRFIRSYIAGRGLFQDDSLTSIPTPLLLSEVGRRNNASRKTNAGGRPKVLKPCPKCGALLGARERARHHC